MAMKLPPRTALTSEKDQLRWSQFDQLARRLKLSISGALREAAFEWLTRHADDPSPIVDVKPNPRARDVVDPFNRL